MCQSDRVLVEDRIEFRLRQWVVRKWGEAGKMAYLFHCPWCMSLWVSLLIMPQLPCGQTQTTH